jgi:hypothetical protein
MVIDHIDRDASNNKWDNLRLATISQNAMNKAVGRDRKDKTLPRGIFRCGNSYRTSVMKEGVQHQKYFSGPNALEEAKTYVNSLRVELHGQFAPNATKFVRRI